MAKKKFDPNSAFKKITGIDEMEKTEEISPIAKATNESAPLPKVEKITKPIEEKLDYVGAYYRISPKHIKAIKIREAFSDDPKDKDKSAIVRAALDLYLSEELKKL